MRNIEPNRAKFISFWASEKNSREMWQHRAKFSYGGIEIFFRGVRNMVLVTCNWQFRFYSPVSAQIHAISLYLGYFAICRASHTHIDTALRALLQELLVSDIYLLWNQGYLPLVELSNSLSSNENRWALLVKSFL